MKEVYATKCSRDKRPDLVSGTWDLQLGAASDMREHIALTHLD